MSDSRPIKGPQKRKSSSTSSSDLSPQHSKLQQDKKRPLKELSYSCEEDNNEEMATQTTLEEIMKRMESLATKEDIVQMRSDMNKMCDTITQKMDRLEGRFYEIEKEMDNIKNSLSFLKKDNTELKDRLNQQDNKILKLQSDLNDKEQYDRRWNLRVYNVPEEKDETATMCASKCCKIFTEQIGVTTTEDDIEVAHRTGPSTEGRRRPIIVRFRTRQVKDNVLRNRKKLKNKGVSVGEDLTAANYRLVRDALKHSFTLASWSSQGKIFAKLKNGKTVQIKYGANIEELFRREMSASSI